MVEGILTTGQIAKMCQVAPRTVVKWTDSKMLRCHRIPGSQDRRVFRADLEAFAKKHEMPLLELEKLAKPAEPAEEPDLLRT